MRKFYTLFMAIGISLVSYAQSTSNYAFTTGTNGSLALDINGNVINMSTGTTQLIAASTDDVASAVTNIGFDFWFYGTRFTQFSATSNALVALGGIVAPSAGSSTILTPYQVDGGTPPSPKLGAFTADLYVSSTGKVHYKVVGTAPNRCLVIEFLNMALPYNTTLIGGSYQVRLYESTGVVEYLYGAISKNTDGGAFTASFSIGFSVGTASANTNASVTTSTQSASYGATFNTNTYSTGVIADLNSAADGSRRYYRFAPPVPTAPSGLSFSSVSAAGMTLNWTDNSSNELAFLIYRSNDGGTTYNLVSQVAANTTSSVQSGLLASTSYMWRVIAVSEGAFSSAVSGTQSTTAATAITSNGSGGGIWSSPASWTGGVVPSGSDIVTIKNGDAITLDISPSIYGLTVGEGTSGSLMFETGAARTLSVAANVLINSGANFSTPATGTINTHVLSLGGNLTNNGILDLSTNLNLSGATIAFTGDNNSTFTGTGSINNLYALSLSKASITNTVELNLPAFTVSGVSSAANGALLASNSGSGTLKISGTNTFSGVLWSAAAYTIPSNMGLWLNNPNFTVTGQNNNATNNGLLRITAGTYNVGGAINNSIGAGSGAAFTIEGGTLNVAGRLLTANAINYTQTGGSVNVSTVGNNGSANGSFSLSSGTFNMSGGTITIVQINSNATATNRRDYFNAATSTITGGTLYLGTGATSGNSGTFDFRVYGNVPNMVIDNTSNNKTVTAGVSGATAGSFIFFAKNITINTGTTFNLGGFAVVVQDNMINNGIINGNTASSRLYFGGTLPQTYSGTGIAGTTATPLLSFDIDNPAGLTIDPSVSNIVTNRIILFGGDITNTNKLTLGSGGTSTGVIQIGNTTTPSAGGNFDVAPTFNLGSGGQNITCLRTTIPINLTNAISPSRVLNNLIIDPNTSTVTLSGGNLQVTGTLTLTTGRLDLGGSTLTLGTSATSRGTLASTVTNLYNGKFKRWFGAVTNTGITGDFPIGISTVQRRARVEFTTASASGGTLTAEYIAAAPGTNGLPLNDAGTSLNAMAQNGYWTITPGDGLIPGTYNISLVATGYNNINNPAELRIVKRANASQPWALEGTHAPGTGVIALRNGLISFSDFAIAADGAINPLPANLLTFTGARQGSTNLLRWTIAQEKDVVHYEIQRSDDNGGNWLRAGVVNSIGTTSSQRSYNFTDQNFNGYKQLYRLRQVDINGTIKMSNIVMISTGKISALTLSALFPNPAISKLNLIIDVPTKDNILVTLIDAMGRTVKSEKTSVELGVNTLDINISDLAKGSYLITLRSEIGNQTTTSKFVKE